MYLQNLLKDWEKENWILLSQLQERFMHKLWQMIKLKKLVVMFVLFFIYLSLQLTLRWVSLFIGFMGRAELKFHVAPGIPSSYGAPLTGTAKKEDLPSRQVF